MQKIEVHPGKIHLRHISAPIGYHFRERGGELGPGPRRGPPTTRLRGQGKEESVGPRLHRQRGAALEQRLLSGASPRVGAPTPVSSEKS